MLLYTRMDTRIKICGLTRPQDVEAALRYGADALGFVVACQSPRLLEIDRAARLANPLRGIVKTVAVTVNPTNETLDQITEILCPDYIQLHGRETPSRIREIRTRYTVGIIKALPIANHQDVNNIADYQDHADMILLDAKPEKPGAQAGGHGQTFDWSLLKGIQCQRPLILAGGLNSSNIKEARQTGLSFFDVSSGVECQPGIKDPAKINAFMKACGK